MMGNSEAKLAGGAAAALAKHLAEARARAERPRYYTLDGEKRPVPAPGLGEWADWFAEHGEESRVGRDECGGATVSTVFLGIDHNHGQGPPLLFETMVFVNGHGGYMERYHTYDDALIGHMRTVKLAKEGAKGGKACTMG